MDMVDYKAALISTAEREAAAYLKTGKVGGELDDVVQAIIDSEGVYDIVALLLTDAHKGDIRSKMEELGFSDYRVEREITRNESREYEDRADARRYDEMEAARA